MNCYRILTYGVKSISYPSISAKLNKAHHLIAFKKMSSIVDQLEQERQHLEAKVNELVEALESRKSNDKVKVPKDAIIKSKEEREAITALEQLELKNTLKDEKQGPTSDESKSTKKLGAKQKGSTSAKEVDKPVDISRLDLRIGKIVDVEKHPDADSLYVEKIDCGDETGPRTVISGLVKHVPIEEMRNKLVVVLCNLKPVKMRGILSEAMVMCASTPDKVELLQPPENVKPGDRVVFDQFPGEPDAQLNPKKKVWETVSVDIKTNDAGVATYKGCDFKVAGIEGKFKSSLSNVNIR